MQSERRNIRTRKPLSDCTNQLPRPRDTVKDAQNQNPQKQFSNLSRNSSQSSSSPSLYNIPTKAVFDSIKAFTKKRASNLNSASVNVVDDAQNQSPSFADKTQLSTPPRSEDVNDIGLSEVFEPQTVYIRRHSANRSKGKEFAEPLSYSSPSHLKNNPTKNSTVNSNAYRKEHATKYSIVAVGSSNKCNDQNQNSSSVDQTQLPSSLRTPCQSTAAEVFEPQTVYTRRCSAEKRSKGKDAAEPLSGSSGKRIRNAGKQKDADGSMCKSKRQRVPRGKKNKDTPLKQNASKDFLDSYIKEQKAYFEAIDAEKLEEESE